MDGSTTHVSQITTLPTPPTGAPKFIPVNCITPQVNSASNMHAARGSLVLLIQSSDVCVVAGARRQDPRPALRRPRSVAPLLSTTLSVPVQCTSVNLKPCYICYPYKAPIVCFSANHLLLLTNLPCYVCGCLNPLCSKMIYRNYRVSQKFCGNFIKIT